MLTEVKRTVSPAWPQSAPRRRRPSPDRPPAPHIANRATPGETIALRSAWRKLSGCLRACHAPGYGHCDACANIDTQPVAAVPCSLRRGRKADRLRHGQAIVAAHFSSVARRGGWVGGAQGRFLTTGAGHVAARRRYVCGKSTANCATVRSPHGCACLTGCERYLDRPARRCQSQAHRRVDATVRAWCA
jgi:hypothetical protein